MNTETNGKYIYSAKLKNPGNEANPSINRSRPATIQTIEPKKNNLSISSNSSISPHFSLIKRIKNQRVSFEAIEENTNAVKEINNNNTNNTDNTETPMEMEATTFRPKRVKIEEKPQSNECEKETKADTPSNSNVDEDDLECDGSKNGKTKTGIIKNYSKSESNFTKNNHHNSMVVKNQKRPYFSSNYYTLKKMLDENKLNKSVIKEIEESRMQEYKKSKNFKNYQNIKSKTVINTLNSSAYDFRRNNNDESMDISRDVSIN